LDTLVSTANKPDGGDRDVLPEIGENGGKKRTRPRGGSFIGGAACSDAVIEKGGTQGRSETGAPKHARKHREGVLKRKGQKLIHKSHRKLDLEKKKSSGFYIDRKEKGMR